MRKRLERRAIATNVLARRGDSLWIVTVNWLREHQQNSDSGREILPCKVSLCGNVYQSISITLPLESCMAGHYEPIRFSSQTSGATYVGFSVVLP